MAKRVTAFHLTLAALLALAAVSAPGTLAGEISQQDPAAAAAPAAGPGPELAPELPPGMIVAIDPETGEIRQPTAEERRLLAEELVRRFGRLPGARSVEPQQRVLAGGAVMAELDPALHSFAVARVGADGALVTDCVHGAAEAEAWVAADDDDEPPAAAREER